jgi:hypothetical protein
MAGDVLSLYTLAAAAAASGAGSLTARMRTKGAARPFTTQPAARSRKTAAVRPSSSRPTLRVSRYLTHLLCPRIDEPDLEEHLRGVVGN